jgi:hypothetical protein
MKFYLNNKKQYETDIEKECKNVQNIKISRIRKFRKNKKTKQKKISKKLWNNQVQQLIEANKKSYKNG